MTNCKKRGLAKAGFFPLLAICVTGLMAWDDDCNCDRVEFVTRGVGNAVEVNKVTQTIDPWPPYVKNRRLNLNGKRAGIAMHRYEMNRVIPPRGLNSSATAYPNGTANTNGDPQNSMAYGTPNAGGYPAGFQPQQ